MNFSDNELLRKNRTSSLLAYGEAGKGVLNFQANFSEVFEVLSSNDASNYIQIRLQGFFNLVILASYSAARAPAAER